MYINIKNSATTRLTKQSLDFSLVLWCWNWTHKKRCHYWTMDCIEQMGFHAHPAATEGKHISVSDVCCLLRTLRLTKTKTYKHLLFICFIFLKKRFWNITHLSSKYFFLATAWIDAGTRGKPWTEKRQPACEVLGERKSLVIYVPVKMWFALLLSD